MHPVLIVFLAIFMPFFFLCLVIGPLYAAGYAGVYLYYGAEVAQDALYPAYLYETYAALWNYWLEHFSSVSWLNFVLPAFGPLALGIILALVLLWLFSRYVHRIFVVP